MNNASSSKETGLTVYGADLRWGPVQQFATQLTAQTQNWLEDAGSLTARLKQLSRNQFRVAVREERWISDCDSQTRKLFGPVAATHRFWSRRVGLFGAGEQWVSAHTLIPEHSLVGPLAELLTLKEKPLGEYLFNHPELMRSAIDVTLCGGDTWGRRSLFFLHGKPILVGEFFLPALFRAAA